MQVKRIDNLIGPNNYDQQPVICVELKLEWLEQQPFTLMPSFGAQLLSLLPSLGAHSCAFAEPNLFLERLCKGAAIGDVLEHVVVEMQRLARIEVECLPPHEQERLDGYFIAFHYKELQSGLYAFHAAQEIINCLLAEGSELSAQPYIDTVSTLYQQRQLYQAQTPILGADELGHGFNFH